VRRQRAGDIHLFQQDGAGMGARTVGLFAHVLLKGLSGKADASKDK